MIKQINHLIVQAGGKGTRMGCLTVNKPKCLVSIYGKPLLYWLEESFPNAKMYIVFDYKKDVLEKYLQTVPPKFDYFLVDADGTGTCSGLQKARELIPQGESFGIVWSDLLFEKPVEIPDEVGNYVGITDKFKCRWSYKEGKLIEETSDKTGILGFFYFSEPDELPEIPKNGEFVRFLSELKNIKTMIIENVQEIGNIEVFNKLKEKEVNSRFFNSIKIENRKIIKQSKNPEFDKLIEDEIGWYEYIANKNFDYIPKIYKYVKDIRPSIEMERINGKHPYEFKGHDKNLKLKILGNIFEVLDKLHNIESADYNIETSHQVYVDKTIERIEKISLLIPNKDFFIVNGKKVRNLLKDKYKNDIEKAFKTIKVSNSFTVIHGDPTFSNMLIDETNYKPYLFDPRGYFGKIKIFGDPLYDFAKLYYSVVGNYDQFNQRNFRLKMDDKQVEIEISSNGWEDCKEMFEERFDKESFGNIKILHALIWLSLAGYVVDDYDSILGSYFHGLELFEEVVSS